MCITHIKYYVHLICVNSLLIVTVYNFACWAEGEAGPSLTVRRTPVMITLPQKHASGFFIDRIVIENGCPHPFSKRGMTLPISQSSGTCGKVPPFS